MSRLAIPATIEAAPSASRPLLEGVKKQLGIVPNLFRLVSNSPAALEAYLNLSGALAKGALAAPTRERIALAIAQVNECNYCLAAHSYIGKAMAKLDEAEISANRHGGSTDAKADVAVRFAVKVANAKGHVENADLQELHLAGYSDAEVIEIVMHVALNSWTNYLNSVAATEIDFPVVEALKAA